MTEPVLVNFDFDLTELPDGRYIATVERLELATGRESGQPYFNAAFVIQEPEEYAGREVWTVLSFSPRALKWTLQRLSAMAGYDLPAVSVNVADPAFQDQFIGRWVTLRIGSRVSRNGYLEPNVEAIYEAVQKGAATEQ